MAEPKYAPRWFLLILGIGILGYVGFAVVPMIYCHYTGKQSLAIVKSTDTKMEGGAGAESSRRVHYYTLSFDGHTVRKRSTGSRQVGDQLPIIYLPNNPDSAVCGSRAAGLWRTIENSTNEGILGIAIGVAVFFLICAAKSPTQKTREPLPQE